MLSRRFYAYVSNPMFESIDEAIESLEEREIDPVTEEDEEITLILKKRKMK